MDAPAAESAGDSDGFDSTPTRTRQKPPKADKRKRRRVSKKTKRSNKGTTWDRRSDRRTKDTGGTVAEPEVVEKEEDTSGGGTTLDGDASDVEAQTGGDGDVSDAFMLAHNIVEAEDWNSDFAPIAHEIGPVYTHTGDLPEFVVKRIGDQSVEDYVRDNVIELGSDGDLSLPLEHTHVDARLIGPIGRVHVQQRFTNPYDKVIEAVYVFPLPENSAVDGMKMVIGERVIEGVIMEREEARRTYEAAKKAGHTAALLEQERPNVFTQSVANIAPDMKINIETQYVQDLTYDSGSYEFVFPMVVGPRYVPPGAEADAFRINPPVLGRGERSGHDVSVSVRADAGVPIKNFDVPTHDVEGRIDKRGQLKVRLADHDQIPNRDFVLRYDVAGETPKATVLSERVDGEGYFTLIVQPPEADVNALVGTREMIFVVDVSGSMRGVPLAMSKELMERMLNKLRPVDTFNIMTFASGTTQLFAGARPASRKNLKRGMAFVEQMNAGGGTRMLDGVKAALDAPVDAGIQRVLVFMTDGYIGNEDDVISTVGDGVESISKKNAKARVFAFGVGSSTNRYLIDELADVGDGTAEYALTREDPQVATNSFFNVIDHPVWTDVELDFGELAVDEDALYPTKTPDLFASHPLVVHGRYSKAGSGTVTLKARSRGEEIEVPLEVELSDDKQAHRGVLGTLWARSAIGSLERDMLFSSDYDGIKASITELGLRHGIVTAFTSFVAVDESQTVGDGNPARVDQQIDRPEGVGTE